MTFAIRQEKFEGPLDLLLTLIEERKLSINEISLSEVANQYLEYLKSCREFPSAEAAAFLTVASTLILIKSRSLLPFFQISKEEEESIEDLEKRLEVYKKVRQASQYIKNIFGRKVSFPHSFFAEMPKIFLPPANLDCSMLKEKIKELLLALPPPEVVLPQKTVGRAVTIEEKINELKERIQKSLKMSFDDFKSSSKVEIIIGFLAMLELIKQGLVLAEQKENFGNIHISRYSPTKS